MFSPIEITLFVIAGLLAVQLCATLYHYHQCPCDRCQKKRCRHRW